MAVTSSTGVMMAVILDMGTPQALSAAAFAAASQCVCRPELTRCWHRTGMNGQAQDVTRTGVHQGRHAPNPWRTLVEDNYYHETSARRDRHAVPRR